MPETSRKQREIERREADILDGVLALCAGPDWESVTMDQIAERAEVSKGTLYNHFQSKDEMLFRLMIRFYQGLLSELAPAMVDEDPVSQFREVIRMALDYHVRRAQYRFVVLYCERADFKQRAQEEWKDDLLALDRSFNEWAMPLIESGMASGAIAVRPANDLLLGLHATFKGAVALLWGGDDWCSFEGDGEDMVRAATEFMMAGLVGRP